MEMSGVGRQEHQRRTRREADGVGAAEDEDVFIVI